MVLHILPPKKFLSYIVHFVNNSAIFIPAHGWIISVGEIPRIGISRSLQAACLTFYSPIVK